jgi:MFS family permease
MRKKELQRLQDTVLLWTITWAVIGLALGIVQLLRTGKVSWIPSLGLGAAAAGLGMGIFYAVLMVLTDNWRDSLADTPGLAAQLGPPVLCGAGAGVVGGLVAGGLSGAAFFGVLGAATAAIFNWKAAREEVLRARAARRKPVQPKAAAKPVGKPGR